MKIRVFRAGHGDAVLLTSSEGKNVLVDGGEPHSYKEHWADFAADLRASDEVFDLVCVSHTDRDHIGGILSMMTNEVKWRVHDFRASEGGRAPKEPELPRPPKVEAIWHNAFLEKVRQRRVRSSDHGQSALDASELLYRTAMVHAGGGDVVLRGIGAHGDEVEVQASELADQLKFLAQSVGDAIELSRRIGAKQLNIPLNDEFGGKFVLRKRGQQPFDVGDLKVTVLGPTQSKMDEYETVWNEYLQEKADYIKRLQKRHDKSERDLRQDDVSDVLDAARQASITLAGNQAVTPPNMASIIMLVEEGERSILLTGDADDPDILEGLKATKRLDDDGRIHLTALKVPHHGAHNSYSDEFAAKVTADHYIFCGDGGHSNPELDVIEGYLKVLFEGVDGADPAVPDGVKPVFWFNDGPKVAGKKYEEHWAKVEDLLKEWKGKLKTRFRYKLMPSGNSFLVQ